MKAPLEDLTGRYSRALQSYLEKGGEDALLQAYQVGREALTHDLGVLEVAALHQEALVSVLLQLLAPTESSRIAKKASEFFAETLASFEMTHRGFQEANAILSDLNDELRRRVEVILRDYKAAQDQIDQHKKMERMKDEFISFVSHELRTPLTSIHGSLALLNSGLAAGLPEKARQLLAVAHRNSQRLVRLIGDVLDLQKIESGTMPFDLRPLEIGPFLEQAIEANEAYGAQFRVSFVLNGVPPRLGIRADPDRLMQVITNLLSNAAKFSPSDGTVLVSAQRHGGVVRITVTDRGPGIPEEFRARIFQRFAQADASTTREKGGTGLGLNISKAIVERMGGLIGFETEVGTGTIFYVELPLVEPG
ncbi:MAG TPA: HAMP domain-containing sensor histidine kinase, partial [Vicinamibacteria bacterium]|nr:HAMP domain-containing sensor histidine kinase [Vicinamibacteria bacterium]